MPGRPIDDLRSLASGYDSDKAGWPGYLRVYDDLFRPYRDRPCVVVELGIRRGGSLLMWRDLLPKAQIVGVDLEVPVLDDDSGRVHMYAGSQDDPALLERVVAQHAPDGIDVVIDDCAHVGSLAAESFRLLFPALKPGGTYVVEDWGTGYWPDWPDGESLVGRRTERPVRGAIDRFLQRLGHRTRSIGPLARLVSRARRAVGAHRRPQHVTGMVGFVKALVDEVATADVHRGGGKAPLGADIAELTVHPSIVVVRKAETPSA